jgi:hypothetical protein
MEKIPPSGIIQKTTSKIALIGLAAASMMITLNVIGAIMLQEASAAKPSRFCYDDPGSPTLHPCFPTISECLDAHRLSNTATSPCRPEM